MCCQLIVACALLFVIGRLALFAANCCRLVLVVIVCCYVCWSYLFVLFVFVSATLIINRGCLMLFVIVGSGMLLSDVFIVDNCCVASFASA